MLYSTAIQGITDHYLSTTINYCKLYRSYCNMMANLRWNLGCTETKTYLNGMTGPRLVYFVIV